MEFSETANHSFSLNTQLPKCGHDQERAFHLTHCLAKLLAHIAVIWFKVDQSPSLEFVGIQESSFFFLDGNKNVTLGWLIVTFPSGYIANIPL